MTFEGAARKEGAHPPESTVEDGQILTNHRLVQGHHDYQRRLNEHFEKGRLPSELAHRLKSRVEYLRRVVTDLENGKGALKARAEPNLFKMEP